MAVRVGSGYIIAELDFTKHCENKLCGDNGGSGSSGEHAGEDRGRYIQRWLHYAAQTGPSESGDTQYPPCQQYHTSDNNVGCSDSPGTRARIAYEFIAAQWPRVSGRAPVFHWSRSEAPV